ncbi:MAG: NAD(+)/NADH kinase [Dehalococcoidales bacterium]|nr:MAG: NAD(+)/NADH kinase [Dehalococcoidales bacterium]
MKKIGIIFHPLNEAAGKLARELEKLLNTKDVSTWLCSAWEGESARAQVDDTDLVLSIGGDGTILRAAQAILPRSVPITGINLGNLGFMTELSVAEVPEKLNSILAGEGWFDERSLLEAEFPATSEPPEPRRFHALNDIVIAHGEIARVIRVEASVNGEPLTTYKADGVIVSTATGSTGYALAAGGPILHPQAKEILLLPISPHLSASYKLVLPPTSTIELRTSTLHSAVLTVDGHISMPLSSGAAITVKRSENTVRFLRIHPDTSLWSSLEKRLRGKQG